MADKAIRAKPLGLSTKIKNSMMDFTDIKYPTVAAKSFLKNSSSIDSSETVHSPTGQYEDDEFDTSSTTQTQGTNELNNQSDTVESIEELTTIGDYNFEKYQSYSDQRNVEVIDSKCIDDVDIEKLRNNVREEIVENESFLDKLCETLTKDVKVLSKDVKVSVEKTKMPVRGATIKGKESTTKKGRVNSGSTKKRSLDPMKKTELLAQLKAIDGVE